MNFFFGFKNNYIKSNLTIPKFKNIGDNNTDYSVFSIYPLDNKWKIKELKLKSNNDFYFVNDEIINNENMFFLSNHREIEKNNQKLDKKLVNLNNFTDTSPAFRSNFRLELIDGGFSSYQSDYPFSMTMKNGNIVSPIYNLLNKDASENFIIFRNIFHFPTKETFKLYIVDISKEEILKIISIKTNYSNYIYIDNKFIKEDVYIYSEKFLGIPIYVSIKNKHISMEHTHPPHHYILGPDKFQIVTRFKKKIQNMLKL